MSADGNPLDDIDVSEKNPLLDIDVSDVKKKDSSDGSDGSQLNSSENQQPSPLPLKSPQAWTDVQPTNAQNESWGNEVQKIQEPPQTKPLTKEAQLTQRVLAKAKDNWGKSVTFKNYPTPDEKVNALTSEKNVLDEKYSELIKTNPERSNELLQSYKKELDDAATKKFGFYKDGDRYVLPKEDVEMFNKHLNDAISEVQQEDNLKDKSYLKSMFYALTSGSASVGTGLSRVLEAVIPYSNKLGLGDYYEKGQQEYSQKAKYFEDSVDKSISEGNWGAASGAAALNIVEQVPLLTSLAMGNEAGYSTATINTLALGQGLEKLNEMKDMNISQAAKIYNSVMTALNFVALGNIGGNQIINNAKSIVTKQGEQQAQQLLEKSYQTVLQNSVETMVKASSPAIRGYAIGAGTQFSNNLVERSTTNPNKDIMEGVNEAGITWALMEKATTLHNDINNAKQSLDVAIGKVPKNIPMEDIARATGMVLEKDYLTKQNEGLDDAFQAVNNKKIDEIKQKINFIVEPRINKEKINLLNNEINTELSKETPNVEQIGKLQEELNGLEPKKAFPEDEQLQSLMKERDALDSIEGKDRKTQIDKELIPLLKDRQEVKQKFFDDTIKGIDDPIDQDMYREEKQQAKDELKDVIGKEEPKPYVKNEDAIEEYIPGETEKLSNLSTDAEYFQYKPDSDLETGKTEGTEASLPTEKNPVTVWTNPETREKTVIEGHNKLNSAKEAGMEDIPIKEIKAKSKEEALAKAAFENVKKGEMSGITKTEEGYKIDKTGTELDKEGNLIKPSDEFTTSLKRAVADNEANQRQGTEALDKMKDSLQDTDTKKAFDLTKDKVDKGEINTDEVTDRVIKTGTGSLEDESALLYNRGRLKNEETKLLKDRGKLTDEKAISKNADELMQLYEKMAKNDLAAAKIGREASNIFRLRQAYVDSEMSLFNMEQQYLSSKGIKDLTPEQKLEIKEHYQKMQEAKSRIDELEGELRKEREQKLLLQNLLAKSKEQKKADRALKSEAAIANSNERIGTYKSRLKELAGMRKEQASAGLPLNIDLEIAGEIGKIAAEKVYQGIVKLDEVVRNVLDEVKDIYPQWTTKDVEKYLGKYDIEQQKRTVPDEQKILSQLKKSAKLKAKIEAKDYSTPERPEYKPNKALENARSEYQNLKNKWELDRYRDMLSKRPGWEKFLDKFLKIRTGIFLLSGIKTLGKLANFTALELVWSNPKDVLTTGIAKILLPGLTKKAMTEGQINLKSLKLEAKTLLDKQTYKDALSYLTSNSHTHELYGAAKKGKEDPAEFNLNFGKLHGAEKYPLWRSTFNKYAQRFTDYYHKEGRDVSDPGLQKIIEALSAEKADQRIMMSKNKLSTLLKVTQSWMRSNFKVGYYISKFLFPIVGVPTNYTIKTARAWGGLLEFAWRIKGGFEKMTPEDADKALVAFKNGLPGAALGIMALSTNWVTVDEKKKFKIGGWEIPKWLTHHPDLLVLKLYAEAKNEFGKVPKWIKDPEEIEAWKRTHNFIPSAESILLNTIHETPFLDNRTMEMIGSPEKLNQFLENFGTSILTPQLSRDIASFTDREKKIESIKDFFTLGEQKRKPESFTEQLKMGFPWLREQVPTADQREVDKRVKSFQMKHDPKGVVGKGKFSKPAVEGYTEVVHKNIKFQEDIINKKMDQLPKEEFEKYLQDNKLTDDYLWHTQIEGGQTNTANIDKLQNAIIELERLTDKDEKLEYTKAIEEDMKNLSQAYKNKETFRVNEEVDRLNDIYNERHTEKKGLKKEISTDIE
jgi:hypothetical protein